MTTIAEIVVDLIALNHPTACSLPAGYMTLSRGGRLCFYAHYGDGSHDVPRTVRERRNADGRVTTLVVEYRDLSQVEFTWNAKNGPRYRAVPHVAAETQ